MLSCKGVASQMFLPQASPDSEVLSGQEVNVCMNMLTLRLTHYHSVLILNVSIVFWNNPVLFPVRQTILSSTITPLGDSITSQKLQKHNMPKHDASQAAHHNKIILSFNRDNRSIYANVMSVVLYTLTEEPCDDSLCLVHLHALYLRL